MVTFIDYVNSLREKEGLSLQDVCEGICNPQEIHYLEQGKREVDRLLEEAILERLGIGAEDSESYLFYDDYKRWEHRHHILHKITYENFQEAEDLLEKYRRKYFGLKSDSGTVGKLEQQFYYSMLAQLRRCQGASEEELRNLFHRALGLTVPDYEQTKVFQKVLSLKELNLMLEAERYRKEGERPKRYQKIIDYIDRKGFDKRGRGKIYPKAVYYYVRCVLSRQSYQSVFCPNILDMLVILGGKKDSGEWTTAGLLSYCEQALEVLRANRKMYFLWELLCMREILLRRLAEEVACRQKQEGEMLARMICLEPLQKENRDWKEVLEKVYREFQIPVETFEYCYLYVVHGVNCINDVIRIRREMLGMSQKELCEGICHIKTLRRLEKYQARSQKAIVRELLGRLGLSEEFNRPELISGSPEARELYEQVKWNMNNGNWEQVEELITQIKKLASEEIKYNRQAYMREEAVIRWQRKEIDREEYRRKLKEALELTIPYEAFHREGEVYLTHGEQECIENSMFVMEKGSEELLICMSIFEKIYSFYEKNELLETGMGMYDFIMYYIGSKWGSAGQYDTADYYNNIIIEAALRFHRISYLHDSLYDRWWNNMKRIEEGIPVAKVLNAEEELTKCILFSEMERMREDTKFYKKKLNSLKAGS